MEDDTQALHILDRAKEARVSWVDVADAVITLEAKSRRAPDGRTWVSVAAQASHIAEAQLRRFARTRSLLQQAETERPGLVDRIRPFPFSHIEVLGKIWQLDQHKALDLIDRQKDASSFTYLELLKKYQDIRSEGRGPVSPIAAGKQAAQQFINASLNILQRTQRLTSGPSGRRTILRLVIPFEYAKPDFVIRDTSIPDVPSMEAIDCFFISDRTQYETILRKVSQIAFESTFFTRFWCLVPRHDLVEQFKFACDELRLDNVGVLLATKECPIDRTPSAAIPVPDRRASFLASQASKRLRPP